MHEGTGAGLRTPVAATLSVRLSLFAALHARASVGSKLAPSRAAKSSFCARRKPCPARQKRGEPGTFAPHQLNASAARPARRWRSNSSRGRRPGAFVSGYAAAAPHARLGSGCGDASRRRCARATRLRSQCDGRRPAAITAQIVPAQRCHLPRWRRRLTPCPQPPRPRTVQWLPCPSRLARSLFRWRTYRPHPRRRRSCRARFLRVRAF